MRFPKRKFKKEVFELAAKASSIVYQIGEEALLRKKAKRVNPDLILTPEFKEKAEHLKKSFIRYRKVTGHGRGMAAPQVGIFEKFALVYTKIGKSNWASNLSKGKGAASINLPELMIIINPRITKTSQKKYRYPEMCMSAYPIVASLIRPSWIEFEYLDEKAQKRTWNIKDDTRVGVVLNRILMHEIDHLEGIVNIDLTSSKELYFQPDLNFFKNAKFEKV